MQYCHGGKKSKRFSQRSDFTEQIFTGELSGVDSAGVLRQDVTVDVRQKSLFTLKFLQAFTHVLIPSICVLIISENPRNCILRSLPKMKTLKNLFYKLFPHLLNSFHYYVLLDMLVVFFMYKIYFTEKRFSSKMFQILSTMFVKPQMPLKNL